jgi:hypothetical protein
MSIIRLDELIHIEEILAEASAVGLQREVTEYANKFMEGSPEMTPIEAYIVAFNELVK